MTAGFYNDERQPGFGFTVAISVCLHIIFIALVLLLANDSSSRKIITPIYTVDLFAPEKPITPPKIIESESQGVRESKKQRVKEEKATALKKKKEPSLDDAIKKIQARVKKREAEEEINKAVEGLQNKQLEKRIKEIRERVAHKQGVVKSVKLVPEGFNRGTEEKRPELQKGTVIKRVEELEEKYAQLAGDLIHDKFPPLPQELGKDFVEIGVCFPRCKK
ncbi:MAG: hypothetical protein HZB81_05405 [Deltaproteobacteria bacterium]|nr:hypothetical protein [Deltaproteobacteria bacterium]